MTPLRGTATVTAVDTLLDAASYAVTAPTGPGWVLLSPSRRDSELCRRGGKGPSASGPTAPPAPAFEFGQWLVTSPGLGPGEIP